MFLSGTLEHFFNAHATAEEAKRKIIGYRIEPVRESDGPRLASTAPMTCLVTGEVLAGSGGGDIYVSPKVGERMAQRSRERWEAAQQAKAKAEGGRS